MRVLSLLLMFLLVTPAVSQRADLKEGLLIMAHGGTDEWNAAVREAVDPLRKSNPVAIAFGMANPATLQEAIYDLEGQGVASIKVVRLFASGASFLPETEYAFGLREEPPEGHFMFEPAILELSVPLTMNSEGLLDGAEIGGILADRAAKLSTDPRLETILILGHGPGDDSDNEIWLQKMDVLADSVRLDAAYHSVEVATLREDWTGKRAVVEEQLRQLVYDESEQGRVVIVIPFRLFGFGPYAEVFDTDTYRADGFGLLPDERLTAWIVDQFQSDE